VRLAPELLLSARMKAEQNITTIDAVDLDAVTGAGRLSNAGKACWEAAGRAGRAGGKASGTIGALGGLGMSVGGSVGGAVANTLLFGAGSYVIGRGVAAVTGCALAGGAEAIK
jgi:hypothetical protein